MTDVSTFQNRFRSKFKQVHRLYPGDMIEYWISPHSRPRGSKIYANEHTTDRDSCRKFSTVVNVIPEPLGGINTHYACILTVSDGVIYMYKLSFVRFVNN